MNRTIDALPVGRAFSQRTKALAIIDAILCPEWEYRCYSFNSGWGSGQSMASARDGQGAEYFALISNDVIGFTSYEPQSLLVPTPSDGWAAHAPASTGLEDFWDEPAFSMDRISWLAACDAGSWLLLAGELRIPDLAEALTRDAEEHAGWAATYYELTPRTEQVEALRHLLDGRPLTGEIVATLNPSTSIVDLADDITEIGWPTAV
ncbi:conserved hypothetical protein [Rhodococcus sp. RD6.2]|uniref:hypothetical protein n=1 Tax=Rhodococcus sp. RD6.2 TaxID=260936 RepID=UPI00063BBC82|nr:hypothetical protein [Rhodococcus sp. RD6.2]CRK53556.1 conserved hypothetical protein [Rhodococcus sp. RD6.2]